MKSLWHRGSILAAGACVVLASALAAVPAAQAAGSNTITIGVFGDFTGSESFLGPDLVKGVATAVAAINASGGVLGKKLVYVTADDAGDPVDAIPALREMLSVDHPAFVVGPFSDIETAMVPIIKESTVPILVQGGSTQLDKITAPYFWRTNTSDDQEGSADAYWAIHQHWLRAAFAYTTAAGAATLMDPTRAAYEAHGGKVVVTENLVPDQSSYRSQILQIMAAHPQVVFFQQDPQTAGTFFSEVAQLGFDNKTQWMGTDVEYSSDVFKAIGPTIATTNFQFTNNSLESSPASRYFTQWYDKINHTTIPALAAPQGYDAVVVAALAMEAAHSTNGAVFNKYMLKVANPPGRAVYSFAQGKAMLAKGIKINYSGVSSTVDFNKYHSVVGPFGVYKFTAQGNFVQVGQISSYANAKFFTPGTVH
jgi:branched-chain amino acid transport system substrate-binding protein